MSHNTLIIAAHRDIANSTVHAAWLRAVRNAGVADVHDIVATYPDGVIDVPKEQKLIEAHARISFSSRFSGIRSPSFSRAGSMRC